MTLLKLYIDRAGVGKGRRECDGKKGREKKRKRARQERPYFSPSLVRPPPHIARIKPTKPVTGSSKARASSSTLHGLYDGERGSLPRCPRLLPPSLPARSLLPIQPHQHPEDSPKQYSLVILQLQHMSHQLDSQTLDRSRSQDGLELVALKERTDGRRSCFPLALALAAAGVGFVLGGGEGQSARHLEGEVARGGKKEKGREWEGPRRLGR